MAFAYDHDCPFEVFITNLGKYNEGNLIGEWVKFPTTEEELKKVFERIGIELGAPDEYGGHYEEWFITDYDCYVPGLTEAAQLGEYENLDELNYLASKLMELDDCELDRLEAAMEVADETGSVKDIINLIDTVKELQEILGISRPTVYELLKRNEFRWIQVGTKYRISKKSFDEWLDKMMENP